MFGGDHFGSFCGDQMSVSTEPKGMTLQAILCEETTNTAG